MVNLQIENIAFALHNPLSALALITLALAFFCSCMETLLKRTYKQHIIKLL